MLEMEGIRQHIRNDLDIVLARFILAVLDALVLRRGRKSAPSRASLVRVLTRRPAVPEAVAPLEGLLDRFRPDDLYRMVEILESRGLIESTAATRFGLALSDEGRHFLRGFGTAPPGLVGGVLDRREEETDLHRALRTMRRDLAVIHGLPRYRIFADRTLRAIAARRPATIDELRAVPGIGDATAAAWGPQILECIRNVPPVPAAERAPVASRPAVAMAANGMTADGGAPPGDLAGAEPARPALAADILAATAVNEPPARYHAAPPRGRHPPRAAGSRPRRKALRAVAVAD
jgi:hypothetical protein